MPALPWAERETADPAVAQARAAAAALLYGSRHPDTGQLSGGVAAWAIVHGIATLWLNGNLPPQLGDNPEEITRIVASHLRIPPPVVPDRGD